MASGSRASLGPSAARDAVGASSAGGARTRAGAAAPRYGGRVAFVGGVDGHPQLPSTRPTRAAAVFDPLSYSWSQLAPMAAAVLEMKWRVEVLCSE